MDPVRLRETAASMGRATGCGCDPEVGIFTCECCDANYLAEALQLLTCPDPLTLARAVEVMGREPDETEQFSVSGCEAAIRSQWWTGPFYVRFTSSTKSGKSIVTVDNGRDYHNPTVGQFACLVLAAKQGVVA